MSIYDNGRRRSNTPKRAARTGHNGNSKTPRRTIYGDEIKPGAGEAERQRQQAIRDRRIERKYGG